MKDAPIWKYLNIAFPFFYAFLLLSTFSGFGQKKALNIAGIHQLVDASKSEYSLQNEARNRQAVTTANEQQNKTMLARLKMKYRELQQRYHALGTVINAANIGIQATPMVNRIVQNQLAIYQMAQQNPALIGMAYHTEIEFVSKSRSLVNYLIGLSVSIGAVNQMKASDRKILFDYVLTELSGIQEISAGLLNSMQYMGTAGMLRSLNPFQNYIDKDKELVQEIIRNARF
ncbi:MAG TPA: hypothetical protein VK541_20375 [Pedobacter sp.]|uniref:hypothetical protein n=1 Tax=Pedobacter sp. TaxID=1411316 RepID=UPI002C20A56F|nr:hypothetical protein [Pedobacter sp.]HMI04856.1 hypothetical protein [Pedobacter sp.]